MLESDGTFEIGSVTDKGRVREENEDALLVAPQVGIYVVADGMGGHEAGRLASTMIVEELAAVAPAASAAQLLTQCEKKIAEANRRIRTASEQRGGAVIGSTIASLLIYHRFFACVWSGDSRIYLIRNGAITQLTRDHTEVEDLIEQGVLTRDEALRWPRRNVITRAIGVCDEPELELVDGALTLDDTFLLCSDGLTTYFADEEILRGVEGVAAQAACDELLRQTLQRGGADNITIVVIRYKSRETTKVLSNGAPKVDWDLT